MSQIKLNKILKLHEKWLRGEKGGKCADLRGRDLHWANLCGVNLKYARLDHADLRCACLNNADLSYANLEFAEADHASLYNANLHAASLNYADLTAADLVGVNMTNSSLYNTCFCRANLSRANLRGAALSGAKLGDVRYSENTAFFAMCCPEKGSFIGFKRCGDYIVELLIPKNAKRSSATTRKCRCDKAKVISITNLDGTDSNLQSIASEYDKDFIYTIGKYVCVSNFDNNRWNECAPGIHFFITRGEAVNYVN